VIFCQGARKFAKWEAGVTAAAVVSPLLLSLSLSLSLSARRVDDDDYLPGV
jgi:hypothetical protein